MSMLTILSAAALAGAAAPPMSAGQFLREAKPLLAKGRLALLRSSEARGLGKLLVATAQQNRARLDANRAAGRPVTTCLPPKGKAKIELDELMRHLEGLSPAQQAAPFDAAFAGLMARKYPCRT